VIIVFIKFDGGNLVIYRHEVVGRCGSCIHAYKFRTMIPDADDYLTCYPDVFTEDQRNMKLTHGP